MAKFEFPENATPISDCSGLKAVGVQNLKDLNRVEAENILSAQLKYFRSVGNPVNWFKIKELNNIHQAMFGNVWEWAGKYRKTQTSIGVKPGLIPTQLAEFCDEVMYWLKHPIELTFIEMSARIHHRLVYIHPFENGNGRFSRFVADLFLLAFKCQHPIWPSQLDEEGIARRDYIIALKEADKGNYESLINFMKRLQAADPMLSDFFRNDYYRTLFSVERYIAMIKALLKYGNNSNHATSNGHHSLQLLLKSKHMPVKKFEILRILVEHGAEVDISDRSGLTPFQIAVDQGCKDCALYLLSKGARSIAPPGEGYTKYYSMFLRLP